MIDGISSPEVAEAIACREGLALARDLGMQKLTIASDCVNVVRSIQGPGMDEYGHIVVIVFNFSNLHVSLPSLSF